MLKIDFAKGSLELELEQVKRALKEYPFSGVDKSKLTLSTLGDRFLENVNEVGIVTNNKTIDTTIARVLFLINLYINQKLIMLINISTK